RLTQPQADTLEMAAKGYIPVEAARVSISVQGRMTTGASDLRPDTGAPQTTAARGLLKMPRPGRDSTGQMGAARSEQASTWSNRRGSDSPKGDARRGREEEVSSGRFEALLADNIIALPTIRPTPRPEVDTPPPPS